MKAISFVFVMVAIVVVSSTGVAGREDMDGLNKQGCC